MFYQKILSAQAKKVDPHNKIHMEQFGKLSYLQRILKHNSKKGKDGIKKELQNLGLFTPDKNVTSGVIWGSGFLGGVPEKYHCITCKGKYTIPPIEFSETVLDESDIEDTLQGYKCAVCGHSVADNSFWLAMD